VNNVWVGVVDDNLSPVPLGAPGVIVFSGVCVGRGYVNDPERTAAVYLTDPHRPGCRLYKGGDCGRWRPDGKLEFLGRRDSQVKISGFRIEIGEIENTLLRVSGVRDGAVVVADPPDRDKYRVLGVPYDDVGRHDHFFDRGGTSLSAVTLAVALDKAVSLLDITRAPVLADLAALVDERRGRSAGATSRTADPVPSR
jgi:acyl-CoA synthetase (AMP-forming)/AMP-acid ligase II